jgi:asparagine synthase (glutamine-hydrolysing)
MPGICGVVSTCSLPELAELLAEMMQQLKHQPWYVEQAHCDEAANLALGRVTLGFVNAAEQPAFSDDRSLLAVMEGEIYNYAEQRRALSAAGHVFHGDSHAELLLHGYQQEGQAFFRRLQGMFTAAIWNETCRQLILTNDRFGMKPLYYTCVAGTLLVASEIKALLVHEKVSRRVSARGLAQFFTFGQLLQEDTLLEEVQVLPAAGWLTYDARRGSLSVDRYWTFQAQPRANGAKETELLDRIDTAFTQAVDRRVQGNNRLGISLSGGLDARTILAVVDPGRPLTSVTMGVQGSIDHDSAERLARLAQRPHHRYVLDTRFLANFEEHMRHMVHLTDGQYLSQCIVMPTLPFYRELGIEVLLRGHAGELMHMSKAYNYSLDQGALGLTSALALEDWLFRHLRAHMLDGIGGQLFAPTYQDQIDSLARDSLKACLRESEAIGPTVHRIWHLFLSQRLRRETALSMVKFGSLVETRLPYLDSDLIEALMAAPPELKMCDRIQAHILRRHAPAFLDVPNANTGARMGAGPLARLFAKARLKVFAKLGVPGYQPYERLGKWLRQELRPLVERLLLSPRCLERGIFNPLSVQAVVQHHLGGRANHTFLILALMIFEMSQRAFSDGEHGPKARRYAGSVVKAG